MGRATTTSTSTAKTNSKNNESPPKFSSFAIEHKKHHKNDHYRRKGSSLTPQRNRRLNGFRITNPKQNYTPKNIKSNFSNKRRGSINDSRWSGDHINDKNHINI